MTVPLMRAVAAQRAAQHAVADVDSRVPRDGDAVGDGRAVADQQRAAVDVGGPVQLLRVAGERLRAGADFHSVPVPGRIVVSAWSDLVAAAVQRAGVDRREVVGPDGQGGVEVADVEVAGQRAEMVAVVAVGVGQVDRRRIAGGVGVGHLVVGGGIVHDAEGHGGGGRNLIVAVPADSSELGLVGGQADPDVRRALVIVVAPAVPLLLARVSSSLVPPPNARE